MDVFDYVLLRIAGEPFDKADSLILNKARQMAIELQNEKAILGDKKNTLTDRLFSEINALQDDHARKKLLNIKRDIHNNRAINKRDYELCSGFLSAGTMTELDTFLQRREAFRGNYEAGRQIYISEVNEIRNELKQHLRNDVYMRGLMMGSNVLLNELFKYFENSRSTSKVEHTELGLMKYYSRMFSKTSPFSTFTNLAFANLGQADSMLSMANGDDKRFKDIQSLVRLNAHILKYFLNILSCYPGFYRNIELKLNPTLIKDESGYIFLVNSHNSEAFQRISIDDIIEVIIDKYAKGPALTYAGLVDYLTEIVDEESAVLERFVKSLIDYGIIEFDFQISGTDPDWLPALVNRLRKLYNEYHDPNIGAWAETFYEVQLLTEQFSASAAVKRLDIQTDIHRKILNLFLLIHETADLSATERQNIINFSLHKQLIDEKTAGLTNTKNDSQEEPFIKKNLTGFFIRKEAILFEDTGHASRFIVNRKMVEKITHTLSCICKEISYFDLRRKKRYEILDCFVDIYGEHAEVPFLLFYETYHKYTKGEIKPGSADAPRVTVYENEKAQWFENFKRILTAKSYTDDVIDIKLSDLQEAGRHKKLTPVPASVSYGGFLQLCNGISSGDDGPLLGVLNGLFDGYGKYVGRFLPLFDEGIKEYFFNRNMQLMDGDIMAEQNDSSFFNANMHPPLLGYEITVNSNNNFLPKEQQISVKDITVKYDVQNDELFLYHNQSDKRVYVLDLAFQAVMGRTAIFKFLLNFSKARIPDFNLIYKACDDVYEQRSFGDNIPVAVILYPRVVLENSIVFCRKRWQIPVGFLPDIRDADDDWDKFNKIKGWQQLYNIPNLVFFSYTQAYDSDMEISIKPDDKKPQFIDFNNPVLISLFLKLILKKSTISLEEMLPDKDQLPTFYGKKYVTEALIHWNS
jgi:lantibiotic biosynthesis protein